MWDEIYNYIKNLENIIEKFDLYITYVEDNIELINKIHKYFANSKVNINIFKVENTKGADIYPFLYILDKLNLDNYDLVYKLHTKRNLETLNIKPNKEIGLNIYVGLNLWRDFLYDAILGKDNIENIINLFKNNSKIGIAGSSYLLATTNDVYTWVCHNNYEKIVKEYNFKDIKKLNFFAGTIFVIRANILKCLQYKYSISDFKCETDTRFAITAWRLECFLAYIVEAQGYKIKTISKKCTKLIMKLLSHKRTLGLYKWYLNKFILTDVIKERFYNE